MNATADRTNGRKPAPRETIAATLALLRPPAMTPPWWIAVVAVTALTNLADFFTAPAGGARLGIGFALAALARVLLVFWVAYALTRQQAGAEAPATIRTGFWRFAALSLALVLPAGLAARVAMAAIGDAGEVARGVALYAAQVVVGLLLLRLLAWQTALAVGDGALGFRGAWRGLAGAAPALAAAMLAVVAPLLAIHLALTLAGLAAAPGPRIALAIVDGVVSGAQLAASTAVAVVAWQIALARAGLRAADAPA